MQQTHMMQMSSAILCSPPSVYCPACKVPGLLTEAHEKNIEKERSTPVGVMTGASVPRSSPRLEAHALLTVMQVDGKQCSHCVQAYRLESVLCCGTLCCAC